MSVIFGAPEAIAAARCLNARSIDVKGRTPDHPRRCGWCPEELADLRRLVEGFNAWAGYKPAGAQGGTAERHEVRLFLELPRDRQRELIEAAQQLVAEPVVPPPSSPAVEPPPPPLKEGPAWLASK